MENLVIPFELYLFDVCCMEEVSMKILSLQILFFLGIYRLIRQFLEVVVSVGILISIEPACVLLV